MTSRQTSRRLVCDLSPESWHGLQVDDVCHAWKHVTLNQSAISCWLVGDWSPIGRSDILVGDWSPINRRLVGDHLATYATSSRSNSVAASLLCMFKRQLATDFNRRLVGDFKKTFSRPLQPLRDFCFILVANQSRTGCRVGVSTPIPNQTMSILSKFWIWIVYYWYPKWQLNTWGALTDNK